MSPTTQYKGLILSVEYNDKDDGYMIAAWVRGCPVFDLMLDEDMHAKVDPSTYYGVTEESAAWLRDANKTLRDAVYAALDEGCLVIQKFVGQDDGGFAGMFFSGNRNSELSERLAEYLFAELINKEDQ